MIIGHKLYYLDTIDSTNEYAKKLIKDAPEGTVVLADEQTDGKGRFGKQWYSPKGGIWMSVILQPASISLVSITAGVAVCQALHMSGVLTGLKWPNDIVFNHKKIGGILTEIVDEKVIVGIGLNLNIRNFPAKLKDVASSVFLETKKHLEKKMVYDIVCKKFDDCYLMLKNNKVADLLTEWRHYTVLLGQEVTVEIGKKLLSGRVVDIDRDGALIIVLPDGKVERVIAGSCVLRM
jgi:BirA family biotin operon repressor/biotin-[acetyl-CoA-carboxylase] ligase